VVYKPKSLFLAIESKREAGFDQPLTSETHNYNVPPRLHFIVVCLGNKRVLLFPFDVLKSAPHDQT
jgi:hypothetical protein